LYNGHAPAQPGTRIMATEHHSLLNEFPQYRDRIHDLKTRNPRFASLYREYQEIDKEIFRVAEEIETPSDQYTEDLKKLRVLLKDQLYVLLQTA
jgi:hypothetical protein